MVQRVTKISMVTSVIAGIIAFLVMILNKQYICTDVGYYYVYPYFKSCMSFIGFMGLIFCANFFVLAVNILEKE